MCYLLKKFQKVHPETFLTNFQFLEELQYRSNLYFLWPNLHSELIQMNCVSSKRVTTFLEKIFFTWNNLVLGDKSSKEWTSNRFWQIFIF